MQASALQDSTFIRIEMLQTKSVYHVIMICQPAANKYFEQNNASANMR
jgi:hypothetical protein